LQDCRIAEREEQRKKGKKDGRTEGRTETERMDEGNGWAVRLEWLERAD
jgi:hypothetical protein